VAHDNAHAPRAGRRSGVLTSGSAVASRWQGVAGGLEGAIGEVPGKEERAGTHQNGGSMVRRRKRRRAAVFNSGGVAPVVIDECGWVLQLEGDQGVRRRWLIDERSSSEGTHWKGVEGGDARTESDVEEGFSGRKPMRWTPGQWGKSVRRSGVDGRGE
jgi:hypothetical protein